MSIAKLLAGNSRHRGSGSSVLLAHASAFGSSTTTTAIDTTGADLLVGTTGIDGGSSTFSDSYGNGWHVLLPCVTGGNELVYCWNPAVGPGHTFSGGECICVLAFGGMDLTSAVYEAGTNAASVVNVYPGTTVSVPSATPSALGDIIITNISGHALVQTPPTVATIDSGFTAVDCPMYGPDFAFFESMAFKVATSGDLSGVALHEIREAVDGL